MEWRDEGLITGIRRHGETSVILELMTREHGRHLGLVKGGRSRRMQPLLQEGNSVDAIWRARIDEHLGVYTIEATQLRAARLMDSAQALHGIRHLGSLLRLLAERESHPLLYEMAILIADTLHEATLNPTLMVRFELALLTELGFGLDLSQCAATGGTLDLAYVSPRSGKAVCREAGLPYHGRLLALPEFLKDQAPENLLASLPGKDDLADAFRLTGFFLSRDLFTPRGLDLPEARDAYLARVPELGIELRTGLGTGLGDGA